MINIQELKDNDKGKWVFYKPFHGDIKKGKIKSWNDKYIFVVYKCAELWEEFGNYTGCATSPCDCFWDKDFEE